MRIALCQLHPIVGAVDENQRLLISAIEQALEEKADLLLTSELFLTGYPPEDLLLRPSFLLSVERALKTLLPLSHALPLIIGAPRIEERGLRNSAFVLSQGKILGIADKILLPSYDVFDEARYFQPGESPLIIDILGKKIAVTICEDLWRDNCPHTERYRENPLEEIKKNEVDLLINLSASPYSIGHSRRRVHAAQKAAQKTNAPLLLCNQVGGNDGLIFDGGSFFLDEGGNQLYLAPSFEERVVTIDIEERKALLTTPLHEEEELTRALSLGMKDYARICSIQKVHIALSGGVDSALVAALAAITFRREDIHALFMPSRFTTEESHEDAKAISEALDIDLQVIPIDPLFDHYLTTLHPLLKEHSWSVMEENLQARIRGDLVMAMSNHFSTIVLATGNKSELAMGYSTLYGDLCGAFSPIGDLTKTRVYRLFNHLRERFPKLPSRLLTKPPSAELRLHQRDEESLPPYPLLDPIIEMYLDERLSPEEIAMRSPLSKVEIEEILHRLESHEFKRRQAPFSLRVTRASFSYGRRELIAKKWMQ